MKDTRIMIGFWLMCSAITVFSVSVFDDEKTIKEKVVLVIGVMVFLAILIFSVWLMVGGM